MGEVVRGRAAVKQDRSGYLKPFYSHIGIFDLATKTAKMITKGGGTDDNVTQDATYSSSNPDVAVATNEPGNKSRVVAVGVGTTTIRATIGTIVSNDATLTVVVP